MSAAPSHHAAAGFTAGPRLRIMPMPELAAWGDSLRAISAQPLELCPDFPAIARRFEAWWAGGLMDRPIFIASANTIPERPITRRLELLASPEPWLEEKLADVRQTHWVGDAIPNLRVDFGPVCLGGMMGGRTEFGADTTWTHAFINDAWSNAPDWRLRDDDPLWASMRRLFRLAAMAARGRFLVCTPDLGGSGDVLLNLRGSEPLCLDVLEQPHRLRAALAALYPAWHEAFAELNRIACHAGAGLFHWLSLWSNQPYHICSCDFNFMISPAVFESLFLPELERQAATVGRAVFHLDGSGAARHIDALLELPELQAIQFTPGEGTPSALAWVDMFRKVQQRGRALLVICPAGEVLALCDVLRPEGLAILITESMSPQALDELFKQFVRRFDNRSRPSSQPTLELPRTTSP